MVAEFESDLVRLRTREGMKVAKAKGRLRGKQPKLNPRQEAHLVGLLQAGEHSTAELREVSSRRVSKFAATIAFLKYLSSQLSDYSELLQ